MGSFWSGNLPEELDPFCLWDIRALYRDAKLPFGKLSGALYLICTFVIFFFAVRMTFDAWFSTTWMILILGVVVGIVIAIIVFRGQSPRDLPTTKRSGRTIFVFLLVFQLAAFLWGHNTLNPEAPWLTVALVIIAFLFMAYVVSGVITTLTSMIKIKAAGGTVREFTYDPTDDKKAPSQASMHGVKKKKRKKGKY